MGLPIAIALSLACALLAAGCDEGSAHAQQVIRERLSARVTEIAREDLDRAGRGVSTAAERVARGFAVEDADRRASELRTVLTRLRQAPHGVPELMFSPMTFIAAVDREGVVICRDREPDPMAGQDVGALFPHIREAITSGAPTHALVDWPSTDPADPPVTIVVYASPVRHDGEVVGAIIAGAPLSRTAERITRQIQVDAADEPGVVLWVYLYRGDQLFHHGTPENLDTVVPDRAAREAGLRQSAAGFTGELIQFGRSYAYGVYPLPALGEGVGFVVFRSDPV